MDIASNKKICYLAHHAFGDVIMKVPAIRWLCETVGAQNVYLTVQRQYLADLLNTEFNIPKENMIIYTGMQSSFKDKLRFLFRWRKMPVDIIILSPTINYKLGKQLFTLSKAKKIFTSKKLINFKNEQEVYYSKFKHKVFLNAEFIRLFEKNISDENFIKNISDLYYLDKKKYPCGKTVLFNKTEKNIQQYVIVHLGSGDGQKHKRIPVHQAKKIVEFIIEQYPHLHILLTGLGNEAELTKELYSQINSPVVLDVANKCSMNELIGVVADASLFISGDCGPVHLASVLKVPVITFFGPTDFDITGPFTNASVFMHEPSLNCMPCHNYSKRGRNQGCPPIYCLNEMNIAPALLEVEKILTGNSKQII